MEAKPVEVTERLVELARSHFALFDNEEYKYKKDEIASYKAAISFDKKKIDDIKKFTADKKLNLARLMKEVAVMKKKERPDDELQSDVEKLSKLRWIERVELKGKNVLITTKRGELRREWEEKTVITLKENGKLKSGELRTEKLDKPKTLPLPPYVIKIPLSSRGSGVTIKLAEPDVDACEPLTEPYKSTDQRQAYFAAYGSYNEFTFFCVAAWSSEFDSFYKKGLTDFANFLAMFLQSANYAADRMPPNRWIIFMGSPLYNKELITVIKEDV